MRFGIQLSFFFDSKSISTQNLQAQKYYSWCLFNSRFAEWVIKMANLGFPRSKAQILEAVKLYFNKVDMKVKAFSSNRPGLSWFYGFLRHPGIKTKKAEKLEQAREWHPLRNLFMHGLLNLNSSN